MTSWRFGLGLALGFLVAASVRAAEEAERGPNIVFIMADDLGYGDLGCYGQEVIRTPRLDGMAREGTRFTQCYAGSTVCAPSRSVLMTGQHTGHTTVRGNTGIGGVQGLGGAKGRVPLRADDVTVAEVLKAAGYVTGMTGKWGLGEPGTSGEPNAQGFDEWFGFLNQRRAHNHYPDYLWRNREKVPLPGNADGREGTYAHDLCTDFALDFIRRHKDRRFFLYVPWTPPHDKYQMPPQDHGYGRMDWKPNEISHAAMVTRIDRDAGRILDLLDELGLAEETIVFFCSDNGAARRWEGRFDSSGPLRGRKRDLTEGGLRTPMIVRWKGSVPAGKTCDVPWWFADVLPTCADLAGVEAPDGIDGISVVETLTACDPSTFEGRHFYWEFHERGAGQAVRWKHWKAIRAKGGQGVELYDLAKDPAEANDLAARHGDIVRKLRALMSSSRRESKEWPGQF
ncbi:MAG: arylsulfatase [Akkermansiaceae bacterium]|nr:arylsulfatase [Akkermansiaceae bacterium]